MNKAHGLALIPILGLALAVWPTTPARAATNNLAMDLCTSCTTAAQFQAFAESNIPSGAYFETATGPKMEVEFVIVNPDDSLASVITAHGPCLSTADGAPCTWDISWDNLTGTNAEEQGMFSVLAPSMSIYLPASVASTFTGTSQAAAVSAWLNSNLASGNPPLGFVILTLFPDGSNAEYSVTGTDPLTFSFVLDSGHAADGNPENDSGELETPPAYTAVTSSVLFTLKELIAVTNSQEAEVAQVKLALARGGDGSAVESVNSFLYGEENSLQNISNLRSYFTCLPGLESPPQCTGPG